jgi:hypothetical protein
MWRIPKYGVYSASPNVRSYIKGRPKIKINSTAGLVGLDTRKCFMTKG